MASRVASVTAVVAGAAACILGTGCTALSSGANGPSLTSAAQSEPSQIALASAESPVVEGATGIYGAAPTYPPLMPTELNKAILPNYRIAPPDILMITQVSGVPSTAYPLQPGDMLAVNVPGAFQDAPIAGAYAVGFEGALQFGPPYESVTVAGLTLEEAKARIRESLARKLNPEFLEVFDVTLLQVAPTQQIMGQHMVGPDGRVNLGIYGSIHVVGLTIEAAADMIESRLRDFGFQNPQVAVDIFAYNSMTYYVVTEGGGLGDSVTRFPVTGNETVLDALANVQGLTEVSSKRIWVARPGANECGEVQILPVDYCAVTRNGDPTTNFQLLPGDRVFIAEDNRVAFDNSLAKTLAPIERMMGFSLLGVETVTRFSGKPLKGGGNPQNNN